MGATRSSVELREPAALSPPARLLACACACLALAVPAGAAPARPVTIDAPGVWTLERLGYDDGVVRGLRTHAERTSVLYRLPPHASQGPQSWYLIRLHFRLEFAPRTPAGIAYVSASTNGRAAAQIKFTVDRAPGRRQIRWSAVGIVHGSERGVTRKRAVELRYANYLQFGGVAPGENVLTFQLERLGPVQVERFRVFDDSGIELSPLSPASIELRPVLVPRAVRVGDEIEVGFRLRNNGERLATRLAVGVAADPRFLTLRGAPFRRLRPLAAGASAEGSFRFVARRAGRTFVDFGARGSSNRPGARVAVRVEPRATLARRVASYGRVTAGVALFALSAALLAVARRSLPR